MCLQRRDVALGDGSADLVDRNTQTISDEAESFSAKSGMDGAKEHSHVSDLHVGQVGVVIFSALLFGGCFNDFFFQLRDFDQLTPKALFPVQVGLEMPL